MKPHAAGERAAALGRLVKQFGRSAAVGLVATAVDLSMLALLIDWLAVAPAIANVPALVMGTAVQFVGNKYYAFGDASPVTLGQSTRFGVVAMLTLLLDAVGFHALAVGLGVHYLIARPLSEALVYIAFSFPLWLRIFRASAARPRVGGSPSRA